MAVSWGGLGERGEGRAGLAAVLCAVWLGAGRAAGSAAAPAPAPAGAPPDSARRAGKPCLYPA